jgi:dinuclear metal center YbgI/SA1388 family protein
MEGFFVKIREVLNVLKDIAPLELAEDYDAKNGIQIEGPNVEVKRVLTCLDVTPMTIKVAVQSNCHLVISHHQPIVTPVGTIMNSEWYGKIIIIAVKHDVTVYSIHTAYDAVKGGINDYIGNLIGLEDMHPLQHHNNDLSSPHGMGRVGKLKEIMYLDDFARQVKDRLKASTLKIVGDGKKVIQKVAVGTGNGLALVPDVLKSDADVYVTGDVQYRDMRTFIQNDMALIAVEHDDTEKFFSTSVKENLEKLLPQLEIIEYNDKFYHTF